MVRRKGALLQKKTEEKAVTPERPHQERNDSNLPNTQRQRMGPLGNRERRRHERLQVWGQNVNGTRVELQSLRRRETGRQPPTRQEHMETGKMGKDTQLFWDTTKILPGTMGQSQRRKHRQKKTANLLRMQDELPLKRGDEKPREEGSWEPQRGQEKRSEKREIWNGERNHMPNV